MKPNRKAAIVAMCLLGANNTEIGEAFGVDRTTVGRILAVEFP